MVIFSSWLASLKNRLSKHVFDLCDYVSLEETRGPMAMQTGCESKGTMCSSNSPSYVGGITNGRFKKKRECRQIFIPKNCEVTASEDGP